MRRWMMAAGMLGLCVCAAHGRGLKGEIASDRKAIAQQKSDKAELGAVHRELKRDLGGRLGKGPRRR